MSKMLSVKLEEEIFLKADKYAKKSHVSRNAYINKAVRFMNRLHEKKALAERYRVDSREVRSSSEAVLKEFDSFADEGL